ncbi:MAG: hypothetical protein ABI863_13865 [Ginsengibacter sp.]
MRFLLSFILSSFVFIAPFRSNAGEVPGKQITANFESKTSATEMLNYSISGDYAVAVINSNHRYASAAQYRFNPFTNFIYSAASRGRLHFFYKQKYFAGPHLYCKRIGLKLIFPEHYFW